MEGVEGHILIKKKKDFIKLFSELSFDGTVYVFNGTDLVEIPDLDTLLISEYINNNELIYTKIALIDSSIESDYNQGMKFFSGDTTEVIEKLDRDITWISILVPIEFHDDVISQGDTGLDDGDTIFGELTSEHLEKIGHINGYRTKLFLSRINLLEGTKDKLYLPFENKVGGFFDRFYYIYAHKPGKRDLFVRNILLKDFNFTIKAMVSIYEPTELIINIKNRKIIPDISRNSLDSDSAKVLNDSIGRVLHNSILNDLPLSAEEKASVLTFINTYYKDKTMLEK